jgi:hypothetical protein
MGEAHMAEKVGGWPPCGEDDLLPRRDYVRLRLERPCYFCAWTWQFPSLHVAALRRYLRLAIWR